MSFAKWVFTLAGVYGVVTLAPMLFLRDVVEAQGGPMAYPENFYGFVGTALAFQLVFLVIGRDPARFRPLMLPSLVEKLAFGLPVWWLYARGEVEPPVVAFATVDLALAGLFVLAWFRTRPAS